MDLVSKKPELILSGVNSVALVGSVIYFNKTSNQLQEEVNQLKANFVPWIKTTNQIKENSINNRKIVESVVKRLKKSEKKISQLSSIVARQEEIIRSLASAEGIPVEIPKMKETKKKKKHKKRKQESSEEYSSSSESSSDDFDQSSIEKIISNYK